MLLSLACSVSHVVKKSTSVYVSWPSVRQHAQTIEMTLCHYTFKRTRPHTVTMGIKGRSGPCNRSLWHQCCLASGCRIKTRVTVALSRNNLLPLLSFPPNPQASLKEILGIGSPSQLALESPQLRKHICFTPESSSVFMTIDLLSLSLCNMLRPHLATSNNSFIFLHVTLWARNLGEAQGCHSSLRSLMQTCDHYFLPLLLIPFPSIHAYF